MEFASVWGARADVACDCAQRALARKHARPHARACLHAPARAPARTRPCLAHARSVARTEVEYGDRCEVSDVDRDKLLEGAVRRVSCDLGGRCECQCLLFELGRHLEDRHELVGRGRGEGAGAGRGGTGGIGESAGWWGVGGRERGKSARELRRDQTSSSRHSGTRSAWRHALGMAASAASLLTSIAPSAERLETCAATSLHTDGVTSLSHARQ